MRVQLGEGKTWMLTQADLLDFPLYHKYAESWSG